MARSFNGTSDDITVADNAILDVGSGDFTICFWYKSGTLVGSDDRFFAKGTSSGGCGLGIRYELFLSGSGLDFAIDDNVTKVEAIYATTTDLQDDNWHLWICERDAGTHLKIFEDGNTERATSGGDGAGNIDNGCPLRIGANTDSSSNPSNWANGEFAEFVLFKRLLTGEEKDFLFNTASKFIAQQPVFNLQMFGDDSPEVDRVASLSGTVTGTTKTSHPPIRYTGGLTTLGVG